jgi:hypothetical protein
MIMEPLLDKMTRHLSPLRVAAAGVCSIFFKKLFGLPLLLSVLVEIAFYLVMVFSGFDWLILVWWCFHYPAYFLICLIFGWRNPESIGLWQAFFWVVFMLSAAVFQWFLIILAGTWIFRHFRRKHDKAA